jgi:Asp/Glu/hydantoin racemase
MARRLAFLHTVSTLAGLFNTLAKEILPADVEVFHIADEALLKAVLAQGGLSPFIYRRVSDNVMAAEQAGASAVLFTCSSISPCAETARLMVNIPVLKVDEPMVNKALSLGTRIGVVATASTTLKPTTELVQSRAALMDKKVQVEAILCQEAYIALSAGDVDTHDRLVRETLQSLMARSNVIVLAQASMARVPETIPAEAQTVPILTSPRLAVEQVRDVLNKLVG